MDDVTSTISDVSYRKHVNIPNEADDVKEILMDLNPSWSLPYMDKWGLGW